jgi:uncharacterized protein YkwD
MLLSTKRRSSVLTVCILVTGSLALASADVAGAHRRPASRARLSQACPNADTPVTGASASALRAAVLCLINQERSARGLPNLRMSARLNHVAQRHTEAMVSTGYFGHGAEFTLRFSAGGYDWRAAGENIASGYTTPRSVVAGWMASAGHCRNILSPTFRDAGTGVVGGAVAADMPPGTWTEDFGLLMSRTPPSANLRPASGCPY